MRLIQWCSTPLFFLLLTTACHPFGEDLQRKNVQGLRGVALAVEDVFELSRSSLLMTDSNRDGIVDERDDAAAPWRWQQGALVLPNLDDDNQDGQADCLDDLPNGSADEKDLTELKVNVGSALKVHDKLRLRIQPSASAAPLRWFLRGPSGWQRVENSFTFGKAQSVGAEMLRIAIEACAFASPEWDGFMTVTLESPGQNIIAQTTLRVSPFLLIPNTQPVDTLFISKDLSGRYDNIDLLANISFALLPEQASLKIYQTDVWQEMWMQDTMEIGYSESSTSRMHVVLNAPRGHDRFGQRLLGHDVGYIEVATPRDVQDQSDGWLDWFGNLEVSPPTSKLPYGRIYYGYNSKTGNSLHPDVVAFLEAQVVQYPIALDVGWLFIKHVDEILSFWPNRSNGEFVAVLPSPARAAELLHMENDDLNAGIQKELHRLVDGSESQASLRTLFGLENRKILFLPLQYRRGEYGAVGEWSNPVNSVALSSSVLFGKTDVPEVVLTDLQSSIKALALTPVALDDSAYQPRFGNVHCATNTLRRPQRVFPPIKSRP